MGESAIVLAHRREIVKQTADKLEALGLVPEIVMAGHAPNPWGNVQVASRDTLAARRKGGNKGKAAHFMVIDECHLVGKGSRYETLAREHLAGGGILLGLSATPIRTDGYGLGNLFESMVRAPDVPWLIEHGFLCQPRHVWGKAPSTKNLGGGHDFNQRLVEESMEPLIGDVVKNWMRHGADRPTIVFASGVDHSLHLVERFKQANISAQHVDGNTENEVRDKIFAHSRDAEIQIISNADVYIEGADFPWISCAVIARITKSLARYLQMGGRPMRTYPGKEDFMLIDHGGHYERFGPLWLSRDWELSTDDKMQERMEAKRKAEQTLQVRCPQCGLMHSRRNCPICNAVAREAQDRYFIEAMLEEVTVAEWEKRDARRGHPNRLRDAAPVDKQRWYSGFLYLESERGKARGWAEHRFREKFSVWPKNMKQIASPPTPDVLAFDKHMRIWYAKSKQKALDAANTKL
jgi:superfamily II DNA or RNA helicase